MFIYNEREKIMNKMRTIGTVEKCKLNEFGNFYQNVDFFNQGDEELCGLIISELSDDVEDIIDSYEFWWAEFIYEGKHYLIAADGECTSGGKYVVAELDPRRLEIRSDAAQKIHENFNLHKFDCEGFVLSIEEYLLIAKSTPWFYRWLFNDDSISDYGTNLADSEMSIATEFFKTL